MKFRELRSDEIECRIGQIGKNKDRVSLLLYKDARCDMNILDEIVGAENWQREHYECKGNLFCRIGIKQGEHWVFKSDCGTESNVDKEKGEASDSFKRACVNWGIGRELYTAPDIWITDCKIEDNKCHDKFAVSEISYKDGRITMLIIKNKKTGRVVYPASKDPPPNAAPKEEKVVCPKCGRTIAKGGKNKAGEIVTPAEVLAKLGSCAICYKEQKNEAEV